MVGLLLIRAGDGDSRYGYRSPTAGSQPVVREHVSIGHMLMYFLLGLLRPIAAVEEQSYINHCSRAHVAYQGLCKMILVLRR